MPATLQSAVAVHALRHRLSEAQTSGATQSLGREQVCVSGYSQTAWPAESKTQTAPLLQSSAVRQFAVHREREQSRPAAQSAAVLHGLSVAATSVPPVLVQPSRKMATIGA
jgi:hypothetical protein